MTIANNSVVSTRDRLVVAAYGVVTCRGVRELSVDEIAAAAGTTKAELQQHFPTIDALVIAVLIRREELWTFGIVEEQSRSRSTTPEGQLLAIFDVLEEWFAAPDFNACTFIKVLLEMGADHPVGRAGIEHLQNIRDIVRTRAERAGLSDVDDFSRSLHILMKGSIIAAAEGDLQAARRAKRMAQALLEAHRPTSTR